VPLTLIALSSLHHSCQFSLGQGGDDRSATSLTPPGLPCDFAGFLRVARQTINELD